MSETVWSYTDLTNKIGFWLNRTDLTTNIPDFIYLAEKRIRRRQEWFLETYMIANSGVPLPITAHPFQLPDYVRQPKAVWAMAASYRHPIELVSESDLHERMTSSISGLSQLMPGIPTIATIRPQMGSFMTPNASGIGPWIVFWPPPQGTATGSGATATAALTNGVVSGVSVTAGGAKYDASNPPSVMFLAVGPGTGAAGTVTINTSGAITAVTVTAGGSGYTSAPTVAFASFAIDMEYVRDLTAIGSGVTNPLFQLHPDLYLYGSLLESAPFLGDDERIPVWESRYEKVVTEINQERERVKMGMNPKRPRLPRVF